MDKYLLKCVDGGWGWGETGAQAHMCAPNEEFVKHHIPGGWVYELLGPTTDNYYLEHLPHEKDCAL